MHEHEYYQELMSRLLDEGLTDQEEASLREHVRQCPDCRQVFAAFTGMTAALREDELAEPPRDLARGVMERIRDEATPAGPRRQGKARSGRLLRLGLGAAACLVLVAAGVTAISLRGSQKDAAESAEAPVTDTYEAQDQTADQQPMTASMQSKEAVYDPAEAAGASEEAASDGAAPEDTNGAPSPEPAPEPSPSPLPVYDAARTRVGAIDPENIPAFEALITDNGQADGSFQYILKVEYRQKTYAFATDDDGGLVWWEEPSTQPLRSPGTFADLHELISMDAPALPQ